MFDIYFQPEYPSVPPLVLITTTGVHCHDSMVWALRAGSHMPAVPRSPSWQIYYPYRSLVLSTEWGKAHT